MSNLGNALIVVLASFLVGTFICGIAYLIEKILIWCKIEMLRADDLVYKCFYDFTKLKATCSGWRCPKCRREIFDRESLLNAKPIMDVEKEEENEHSTD